MRVRDGVCVDVCGFVCACVCGCVWVCVSVLVCVKYRAAAFETLKPHHDTTKTSTLKPLTPNIVINGKGPAADEDPADLQLLQRGGIGL